MAEYIEREAAIRVVNGQSSLTMTRSSLIDSISKLPAADVAPVVYGEWGTGRFDPETGNYEEQCTHCRNFSKEYDKPYCPNCGAKMDGGADR